MGTMTRAAIAAVVLLGAGLAASACGASCRSGNPDEQQLVGTWQSERGEQLELTADGAIHTRDGENRMNGHWELLAPDRIRIRWDRSDAVVETAVRFPRRDQLVLEDVSPTVVYTKHR